MRKNRIISIILSAVMVFCMSIPSFAAEDTPGPKYLAFGDSIGAGCMAGQSMTSGLREEQYERLTSFNSNGTKKTWNVHAVDYSYVHHFATAISADANNSWNSSISGLRAKDYCYILGLPEYSNDRYYYDESQISWEEMKKAGFDSSEYIKDQYGWSMGALFWGKLKNPKNVEILKNAVKTADVITVELGANEFNSLTSQGGVLLTKVVPALNELIDKVPTMFTEAQINALIDLRNDIQAIINGNRLELSQESIKRLMDDIDALNELRVSLENIGIELSEIVDVLVEAIKAQSDAFEYYWDELMDYIYDNKKDGAIVIVTNVPNPLQNSKMDLSMYIGELASILGQADFDKSIIMEPFIDAMDYYIRTRSLVYGYEVADISDICIQPDDSDYYAHPDAAGHMAIANRLIARYHAILDGETPKDTALTIAGVATAVATGAALIGGLIKEAQDSKKTTEPAKTTETTQPVDTACQHYYGITRNVYEANYFREGYSGDIVCEDCGVLLEKGEVIPQLKVAKVGISKLSKGKKYFTVKWNTADVDGYRIQYSTSSSFAKNNKTVTVNGGDKAKLTVKKLKANKKYYVRVKSFKKVQNSNGKTVKVYSTWSAKKSVTTK